MQPDGSVPPAQPPPPRGRHEKPKGVLPKVIEVLVERRRDAKKLMDVR